MVAAPLEDRVGEFECIPGSLLAAHSKVVPGTEQHAREAMLLRESKPELLNKWIWTADFSMYRKEGEESFLYFASGEHNLIFRDITNATRQLTTTGNYIPPKKGIDDVVSSAAAGKTLKLKILDLELVKDNPSDDYGHFDVDPDNLDALNPAQRSFVQTIYGNSRAGNRVYVLTSDYVKNTLKGKEDSAIARASRLGGAGSGSRFSADDRGVGFADCGLFGVLKEAPKAPAKIEGVAAAPINPVAQYTQEGILNYLNTNPVSDEKLAAALLKHATLFYQNRTPKA